MIEMLGNFVKKVSQMPFTNNHNQMLVLAVLE